MTRSIFDTTRRGFKATATLAVVLSLVLLGFSGMAQAKAKTHPKAHPGHHHHSGGAGGGSAPAPSPLPMIVTASPNPVVDTGAVIMTVVQVSTSPAFAGDEINVSSSQLAASCLLVYFIPFRGNFGENVDLTLDNEGNATVMVVGEQCAPGPSVIEADMFVAPYYTALTTLQVEPPTVTPSGVTGYPNPEVETGDANGVGNNDIGNSDIFAVFEIETSPVYAEQPVEISSAQLEAGCGEGWVWISPNPNGNSESGTGVNTDPTLPQAILDDDGNAVFGFYGRSCAASTAQVIADVEAGTHPTYVTSYTVSAPTPGI